MTELVVVLEKLKAVIFNFVLNFHTRRQSIIHIVGKVVIMFGVMELEREGEVDAEFIWIRINFVFQNTCTFITYDGIFGIVVN